MCPSASAPFLGFLSAFHIVRIAILTAIVAGVWFAVKRTRFDDATRIKTFLILAGFALVIENLGYLISTFILMVLLLRAIDPQKWHVVIAVALSTSLVSYLIFAWLLNIPLPKGFLGW